jgi:hypothetical protein
LQTVLHSQPIRIDAPLRTTDRQTVPIHFSVEMIWGDRFPLKYKKKGNPTNADTNNCELHKKQNTRYFILFLFFLNSFIFFTVDDELLFAETI